MDVIVIQLNLDLGGNWKYELAAWLAFILPLLMFFGLHIFYLRTKTACNGNGRKLQ